jgi:thioredoxin 1
MGLSTRYTAAEPSREEVERIAGPAVLEFGSPTCGFCMAAQPAIASAFAEHEDVQHIKIADASGRRLGRSFGIKLWPTLVFLREGSEVTRLVRPREAAPIRDALARIAS